MKALMNTNHFGLTEIFEFLRGKVRDIYDLGDRLVIITTDRISAHDVVMNQTFFGRGKILTMTTLNWLGLLESRFEKLSTYLPLQHHIISTSVDDLPVEFQKYADELDGRFMIVHKCIPLPVEFIVRGYISGSLWKQYKQMVAKSSEGPIMLLGHEFPRDLQESQELAKAIFTPSTKAEEGEHDRNISYEEMVTILRAWAKENGYTDIDVDKLADQCMNVSVDFYSTGREDAKKKGVIIADTKFELGLLFIDDKPHLVIIDEVLTSDSSRFWPVEGYEIGHGQPSFDKQPLRDYLDTLDWNKQPPPPELPAKLLEQLSARYHKLPDMLFGA